MGGRAGVPGVPDLMGGKAVVVVVIGVEGPSEPGVGGGKVVFMGGTLWDFWGPVEKEEEGVSGGGGAAVPGRDGGRLEGRLGGGAAALGAA